jgi:predicted regulator of Ras-like GTPase activity (Roadblock/LC7/MglB family)
MFNKILASIVEESGGGVGAVLMGYDGIAIDQYFAAGEQIDLQMIAVEYANVLKEIRKTAEILSVGAMEEVAIKTDRFHIVVRIITPDYFVAMTLGRDGNFGKARYLLTRETGNLIAALS